MTIRILPALVLVQVLPGQLAAWLFCLDRTAPEKKKRGKDGGDGAVPFETDDDSGMADTSKRRIEPSTPNAPTSSTSATTACAARLAPGAGAMPNQVPSKYKSLLVRIQTTGTKSINEDACALTLLKIFLRA